MNNHYVPQFILKNFGNGKLSFYDIKKNELYENRNAKSSFYKCNLYSDQIEKELNYKIENRFAKILKEKILPSTNEIILNKSEINLIKKFLLISTIRTIESDELLDLERNYYKKEKNYGLTKDQPIRNGRKKI